MVEKIDCTSFADFQAKLQECGKADTPLFILFYAAKSKATGISWCPDCVAAEPVIDAALAALPHCRLLQVSCEREAYRGADFPFRSPPISLTCVPTLMRWSGGCVARLGDADCQRPEAVVQLVNSRT
ncbi:hypothetical protein B484DRAFT_460246 [Ochromonadaceae sp. CCMP2298]|nr:hypothetical protein B484DRAFT_460246 [Ochromonadaceae sp. CCMP2298]